MARGLFFSGEWHEQNAARSSLRQLTGNAADEGTVQASVAMAPDDDQIDRLILALMQELIAGVADSDFRLDRASPSDGVRECELQELFFGHPIDLLR